jgi:hypothetical protein
VISSAVAPSRKATTTVSSVTRVLPTRMTPSRSAASGTGSGETISDITRYYLPHLLSVEQPQELAEVGWKRDRSHRAPALRRPEVSHADSCRANTSSLPRPAPSKERWRRLHDLSYVPYEKSIVPPCPAQSTARIRVQRDKFNIYLTHDAMEETLDAYGEEIIPALEARSAL